MSSITAAVIPCMQIPVDKMPVEVWVCLQKCKSRISVWRGRVFAMVAEGCK
jgi:hypothetical protein